MTIEVRVPQLPESVADATLISWHKKPGDAVARDENLVDLETDKVVLEVPAPAAGVLTAIKLGDGTTVTSGQVLATIEEGATAVPGASAPAIMAASNGAAATAKDAVAKAVASPAAPAAAATANGTPGGKLSPAAKRVVEENNLDPKAVAGSGRDGPGIEIGCGELSVRQGLSARSESTGPERTAQAGGTGCAAGGERTRHSDRSACADDSAARPYCRAHGAGSGHASAVDLVQRGGLESRQ